MKHLFPHFFFDQIDPPGGGEPAPIDPAPPVDDKAADKKDDKKDDKKNEPPALTPEQLAAKLARLDALEAAETKRAADEQAAAKKTADDAKKADDDKKTDIERANEAKAAAERERDAERAELRKLRLLENARVEAAALGLHFHDGALAERVATGDFDSVSFDDKGAPQNLREVLQAIADKKPWTLKKADAVDTSGRDNGRATHIVSDDDVAAAKRKYGIR